MGTSQFSVTPFWWLCENSKNKLNRKKICKIIEIIVWHKEKKYAVNISCMDH